jgi:hypothetical protein
MEADAPIRSHRPYSKEYHCHRFVKAALSFWMKGGGDTSEGISELIEQNGVHELFLDRLIYL